MSVCAACKKEYDEKAPGARAVTCGDECHKTLLDYYCSVWGETKRVTDATTGKVHLVPTRTIMEDGLKHGELAQYPVAES